jgi:hypothetical protein
MFNAVVHGKSMFLLSGLYQACKRPQGRIFRLFEIYLILARLLSVQIIGKFPFSYTWEVIEGRFQWIFALLKFYPAPRTGVTGNVAPEFKVP